MADDKKGFSKKFPVFRSNKRRNKVIARMVYFYFFAVILTGIGKLVGFETIDISSPTAKNEEQMKKALAKMN